LYIQALELLQGCLNALGCVITTTSGNDLIDLLLMALLNNTTILCCVDLRCYHLPQHQQPWDTRNLTFVQSFATFVDAVQGTSSSRLLTPENLTLYSRNAFLLNQLFFQGSAAPAA
jgi:hypothetical protein